MTELLIPLRTYHTEPPDGQPWIEANFHYEERKVGIPVSQTAVVLVDVWDFHHVTSHLERTSEIARTRIAPAVAAARRAGVTVVHAPGRPWAPHYPQWQRYSNPQDNNAGSEEPAWPPAEFRRREGSYERFRRPISGALATARQTPFVRAIDPSLDPAPDDFVVGRGAELQRLCEDRGILHLMYAGFATNICVPLKDYGTRAFVDRGYHVMFLRDCTTAIEGHDTVAGLDATRQAIRELELDGKVETTTSADFISACEATTA